MESTERTIRAIRGAMTGAVLFVLCVVQTTVCGRWKLFGAVPDLMLCAVVLIGYCRGREAGAIAGIAAGVMTAMLGSVGVTVEPVFYLVVGYVSGWFARAVYPKGLRTYAVFLAAALPLCAVRTVIQACLTHSNPHLAMLLVYAVLPELGGTAIMGLVLFYPLRFLLGRSNKR